MSRGSNALTTETNINHVIFGERTILSILIKRQLEMSITSKKIKQHRAQNVTFTSHLSHSMIDEHKHFYHDDIHDKLQLAPPLSILSNFKSASPPAFLHQIQLAKTCSKIMDLIILQFIWSDWSFEGDNRFLFHIPR